jgi:anaerobic magnesium-protoporphyrin IX monomethyl ester cyclase
MKILLVDPPVLEKAYDASYPNLGILYIAGSIINFFGKNSHSIEYLGPKHDLRSHLEYVKNYSPDIYGISFTSKTSALSYKTIKAVKEVCPQTIIVCGGAHATALPQEVMEKSEVDICVVGEGEATFTELVQLFDNRNFDLSKIDGIYYRNNNKILKTNSRKFINNLDEIPFPAWDLIDFKDYPGMHLKKQPVESSLLISRGCPYDCTFCSNPVWKSAKPWLRHRSIENICREIEFLYSRGVREIYMSSDELNFNEDWAKELCLSIKRLNYHDLYFQCNMRADKVSNELAKMLGEINCWLIHLGIESANNRVLKGIGKHITVEQVERATGILSATGVKVFAFMMLYQVWEEEGKLCHETDEEVENSIKFMKKLFRKGFINYMSWQFCTPMPGSRLYEIAIKYNLFLGEPQKIWENFDEHDIALRIPGTEKKSMSWKLKKGIILKDWFMIRSGNIDFRHLWRVKENIKALIKN